MGGFDCGVLGNRLENNNDRDTQSWMGDAEMPVAFPLRSSPLGERPPRRRHEVT